MIHVYLKNGVIVDATSATVAAGYVTRLLENESIDQLIVVANKEDLAKAIIEHGCSEALVWEHCASIYNNWEMHTTRSAMDEFIDPTDVFQEVREEVGLLIEDVKAKLQEVGKNLPDINDVSKGFEVLKNNAIVQVGKIGTQLSDFFGQFKGK